MADEMEIDSAVMAGAAAKDEAIAPLPETLVLEPGPVPPEDEAKRASAAATGDAALQEEASQSPFSVTVGQVYDGPLDLLLFLIRKNELDI